MEAPGVEPSPAILSDPSMVTGTCETKLAGVEMEMRLNRVG